MLFIKAVGLHSPCCFVMFHFSLQNQAELAFKLHTVFICTPNVHENITLCQASKWRLAAPNSTFTVQLNLCYLMSLYMLHLCPGSESAISFLLTGEESHHVLCYFLLTCPEATDPQCFFMPWWKPNPFSAKKAQPSNVRAGALHSCIHQTSPGSPGPTALSSPVWVSVCYHSEGLQRWAMGSSLHLRGLHSTPFLQDGYSSPEFGVFLPCNPVSA